VSIAKYYSYGNRLDDGLIRDFLVLLILASSTADDIYIIDNLQIHNVQLPQSRAIRVG